mmetsp:Transcript_25643/g.65196  ORF Transcript_25643/g.65196 Transcript_25643/m.65196 type:complete len:284 (+) Transcript_25643:248-1099(+)
MLPAGHAAVRKAQHRHLVLVGVSHVHGALAVDRNALGPPDVNHGRGRAFGLARGVVPLVRLVGSDALQVNPLAVEDLQAPRVGVGVAHDNVAIGRDRHPRHAAETSGALPAGAEGADKVPLGVKDLDAGVAAVGHDDAAIPRHGDARGVPELAVAVALVTEDPLQVALHVKDLYPVVELIGHDKVPPHRVHSDRVGAAKLPFFVTHGAEGAEEAARLGEDLHRVRRAVCHDDLPATPDGHVKRLHEVVLPEARARAVLADEPPVIGQHLHLGVCRVAHHDAPV